MRLEGRKLKLLNIIIEHYIQTGEPVGSKVLVEKFESAISSATIRNEMASLVELGFLEQPHTSAGRIPTDLSYRLYVDYLMDKTQLAQSTKHAIDALIYTFSDEPDQVVEQTATLLSNLTQFTCFASTPINSSASIRNLQLVPAGRQSMLVVMITSDGILKTRLCRLNFDLTPDMLRVFSRIVNKQIAGLPLISITPAFIQTLAASLGDLYLFISPVLLAVLEVAKASVEPKLKYGGYENILYHSELTDETKKNILHFFTQEKGAERMLLTKMIDETKIIIGLESRRPELSEISVIVTPYYLADNNAGIIGLIGPTRMDYQTHIATLEYISFSMGNAITDILKV